MLCWGGFVDYAAVCGINMLDSCSPWRFVGDALIEHALCNFLSDGRVAFANAFAAVLHKTRFVFGPAMFVTPIAAFKFPSHDLPGGNLT
jgi:hypothetical protein